jgi:hypothetical protein
MEHFCKTLKVERVHLTRYDTHALTTRQRRLD